MHHHRRFRDRLPFNIKYLHYAALIVSEIALIAVAWRFFILQTEYKAFFIALTVVSVLVFTPFNNAVVFWLNKPKEHKHHKKPETRQTEG